jgi:hypothetical protein
MEDQEEQGMICRDHANSYSMKFQMTSHAHQDMLHPGADVEREEKSDWKTTHMAFRAPRVSGVFRTFYERTTAHIQQLRSLNENCASINDIPCSMRLGHDIPRSTRLDIATNTKRRRSRPAHFPEISSSVVST